MRRFNPEKELYKIQHGNRNKIIFGVMVLLIIIAIGSSYALYQVRYSKRIIYTKVAPFSTHDLDLAVYIDDVKSENFPSNMDTYLLDYIDCDKKGITTASWDSDKKGLAVLTTGPNKCNIYFSKKIEQEFSYTTTDAIQKFTAPKAGYYKLEVWGAQGSNSTGVVGGYGGYSAGNIKLAKDEILYIVVGAFGGNIATGVLGKGGGATYIVTQSALLDTLESNRTAIIMVAGGGGGSISAQNPNGSSASANGGTGGGLSGGGGPAVRVDQYYSNVHHWFTEISTGGTQTGGGQQCRDSSCDSPAGFGKGQFAGGDGYYGGAGAYSTGGGSGYIGSTRLVSGTTQTTNGQRSGNGQAKITYLGNNF